MKQGRFEYIPPRKMSGAEAGLVLGLISSTIAVIATCKDLFEAAHDAQGLPEAFRTVSDNLPLALDILRAAEKLQEKAKEDYDNTSDIAKRRERYEAGLKTRLP